MPMNIKNAEVERLVREIAQMTGETKTEAIRRALEERKSRLALRATVDDRGARLTRFLGRRPASC
jgi:antitoxin VapB